MKQRILCLRLLRGLPVPPNGAPDAAHATLVTLASDCERFSPLVGWETVAQAAVPAASGDVTQLFLDITGIGRLFGGEETLARQLLAACQAAGLGTRVAVAPTIGAAWACAFFPENSPKSAPDGTVDPTASLTGQPDIPLVSPDELSAALARRPVAALRLPGELVATLEQLGVLRIEQLLELPRTGLISRFGPLLLTRLDQAFGRLPEAIRPFHPPPRFQVERCLEDPTDDRQQVERWLDQLLRELAGLLAAQGEGALRLLVRLDCAPGKPLEMRIGLFRPSAQAAHLGRLVALPFERLAFGGAVGRLGIQAELTAPLEHRQGLLFATEPDAETRGREFGELLERLGSRLGLAAVLRPYPRREALPERAFGYRPAVGGPLRRAAAGASRHPAVTSRGKRRTARGKPVQPIDDDHWDALDSAERVAAIEPLTKVSARPLILRHPPEPLEVLAVAVDGPPAQFRWRGTAQRVARQWGPERIETGWWRGPTERRDYYRVETVRGQRFWLFRDVRRGRWFLHGVFS